TSEVGIGIGRSFERRREPSVQFPQARTRPETPERTNGQTKLALDVARGDEPIKRATEVVELRIEPARQGNILVGGPPSRRFCTPDELVGWPIREQWRLALSLEPLGGVIPDRLQHRETLSLPPDQALVDQRLERVDVRFADLLGRVERGAAAEDRQAFEQESFVLAQEVVAPFDGRPQRLLARIDSTTALQEVKPFGETVEQLFGGEDPDPWGCQLEGERKVVEPSAELLDGRARVEFRIGCSCTRGEERGRIVRLEGRDRIRLLAGKPQQFPARHEKLKVRAGGEQIGELGCC